MLYEFYLDDKFYGVSSDIGYMTELFRDYVEVCQMYGKDEVNIAIKRRNTDIGGNQNERNQV